MLSRQKVLLHLIYGSGGCVSRLRLIKLAFLFSRLPGIPPAAAYEFVPYHYGPFSFTLYHDLGKLVEQGMLRRDSLSAAITSPLLPAFDRELEGRVRGLLGSCAGMDTKDLVSRVYQAYPWYASRSIRVPGRHPLPLAPHAVYTSGYEGLQVDGFLDRLLRAGIRRVIDVRANPVSRSYGYHRSTLAKLCERVGLDYVHRPELGIPSVWRTDLDSPAAYGRLFQRYDQEILPARQAELAAAASLIAEMPSVLTCYEADPRFCHRSRLANRIAEITRMEVKELV